MSNRPFSPLIPFLLVLTIVATPPVSAQTIPQPNSQNGQAGLTGLTGLGEGWLAAGSLQRFTAKEWKSEPGAEVLAEYGLTERHRRVYRKGAQQLMADLFIFRQTAGAYGWSTFVRRNVGRETSIDHFGKYVIRLQPVESIDQPLRESLIKSITAQLEPDDRQLPVLPAHLPGADSGLVAGSETYLVGPQALGQDPQFGQRVRLIDFSGLPDMVTADYRLGDTARRVLIVEFHTPQAATEALRLWEEELRGEQNQASTSSSSGPSSPSGTSGPTGPDRPRLVRRIGNYIVELTGAADQQAAEAILGKIRYEQKVFWSGRKVSDIPLEFRPLDPAVLREATKTGSIIVRSLVWVGVMMLVVFGVGLVVGGGFFYWRRFRQHRKGTDNIFSDGGDSIVLNLNEKE